MFLLCSQPALGAGFDTDLPALSPFPVAASPGAVVPALLIHPEREGLIPCAFE